MQYHMPDGLQHDLLHQYRTDEIAASDGHTARLLQPGKRCEARCGRSIAAQPGRRLLEHAGMETFLAQLSCEEATRRMIGRDVPLTGGAGRRDALSLCQRQQQACEFPSLPGTDCIALLLCWPAKTHESFLSKTLSLEQAKQTKFRAFC